MKNLDLWREHAEEMEIKLRHAEEMKPPSDPAERLLHERYLKLKREDLKQLKLQNEYEAIRDCNTPKARKRRAQLENKIGGFDWEQHFAAWDRLTGRLPWIYPPDAPAIPESSPPSPNGSKAISRQRWHGTLPELAEWIHRAQASGHFGNVTP